MNNNNFMNRMDCPRERIGEREESVNYPSPKGTGLEKAHG